MEKVGLKRARTTIEKNVNVKEERCEISLTGDSHNRTAMEIILDTLRENGYVSLHSRLEMFLNITSLFISHYHPELSYQNRTTSLEYTNRMIREHGFIDGSDYFDYSPRDILSFMVEQGRDVLRQAAPVPLEAITLDRAHLPEVTPPSTE